MTAVAEDPKAAAEAAFERLIAARPDKGWRDPTDDIVEDLCALAYAAGLEGDADDDDGATDWERLFGDFESLYRVDLGTSVDSAFLRSIKKAS